MIASGFSLSFRITNIRSGEKITKGVNKVRLKSLLYSEWFLAALFISVVDLAAACSPPVLR